MASNDVFDKIATRINELLKSRQIVIFSPFDGLHERMIKEPQIIERVYLDGDDGYKLWIIGEGEVLLSGVPRWYQTINPNDLDQNNLKMSLSDQKHRKPIFP